MASNVDIKLMAGLDIDSSVPQIKDDIAQIQKKLEAAGIKINLVAEIDEQLKDSLKKLSGNKDMVSSGKQLGENLAASLINRYNIKSKDAQRQIKNLTRSIFQMSFDEIKTGKDNPEFLNTFNQLGEVVKNNANIIKERMGIYDAFYRYFQGLSNIKIPKIVQNDKDWNDLRKVYAGKFVTDPKKKGIPLDSIYQEMAPKFPDLFSGTPDQTKQFEEIVKAVKLYQNDINGLEPVNLKKAVGWEDNMWSDLLSDIGIMREQIKAQMPQIEEEVKASAQNIKKSLMDIDVSFDSAGVEQLTEKVKGYFTSLDGISDENVKLQFFKNGNEDITSFNATIDKGRGIIEKYNFALNNMGQYVYSGGSIIDTTGKDFAALTTKASEYQQKLELLKTTYKDFLFGDSANNPFKQLVDSIDFTNITDRGSLDEMVAKLKQATEQAKTFNAEITKKWSSNAAEKLEQYIKELPSDLDYLEAKFKGTNFKMPENIVQSFANMRKEIKEINNTQDPQQKIEAYNRLTSELNNVTKQYKQLSIEQKNAEKDSKLQSNKNLFSTNIDTWMNKNTAAAKVFSEQLTDIKSKLSTADAVEFDNLKRQFLNIQAEAKQMGLTTSGVVKEIKEGFNSAVTNVVSFTAAMSTFRKMVDTAKSLDTSLFNLQVATGQTREETKGLMNTYNQMAKELGSTTNEIAEAADAWLRQGRSIDETNELIKDSAILSKIGMIDSADATEYLTSSLNGFKLSADSALAVISKLNAVDMNAAADAGGIAESMSKTASSAQQAGVSIDQLIGMIVTLTDVSQASPENVGTAMKSIISRYTQVKANKFVDYESGDDLSNVEKVLAKVGVKIRDGVTDFRDLGDVLDELAGKWNTLNDVEQNAISYNLFGSYQSNFGRILLSNWDKVEKLTEISQNSSTEALDKFSAYTDSVRSHINSMIASYENLASVIADSEFLKGAADTGAAFLDTISAIIDKLGVMSTAMGAMTAGAALKGHTLGVFDNNGTDITFLGKTLEEMKQASAEGQKFGGLFTSNVIQPISNAQSVIDNYNKLVANQCVNQDRINRLTDDLDMRKYLSGLNGAEAGMKGYTASLNMGTAATMGLKVATVALNMAFNMAVMAAVTASVSFLVNKYKELNPTVEEATSALEENQNELQQHNDKVKELSNQLKETQDRLEELNGVGGIKSLTDQEEVDRLKNVTEELKTQLSVEKERQALKARETLGSADKAYRSYDQLYTSDGSVIGGKEEAMTYGSSNPAQEMEYTIAAYKRVQDEYDRITAEIANGGNTDKLTQEQAKLSAELNEIRNNALALYDVINKVNGAEASITDAGQELSEVEKEQFKETERGVGLYADFLKYLKTTSTYTDKAADSVDTYSDEAEQAAQAQEDLNAALKKTPEGKQIAAINEMSTGFEKIDKIMKDVKDKGTFDYSNLADTNFTKAFSGMDSYDNFIKTISIYPSDLGKCQDAFNDLVTDFLNSSGIIDNLTDDTAELTTAMLSNMGVSNAEELVTEALAAKHAQLAAQKYIDANASNDLKDATLDEYVQFLNEASGSEVSKAALAQLELAKLAVNNVKIDTASDIEQVIALANAAGASAANLLELQRAESILGQVEAGTLDMDVPGNNLLADYANNTKNKLNNNTFKFEYEELDPEKFKKAVYDGGVKTNTPSKGSKGSQGAKDNSTIDWISRSADLLERESKRLETALQDTWTAYTGLEEGDAERINELFASLDTPDTSITDRLQEYADSLGMSMEELQSMAADTSGLTGYDIDYIKKLFTMDLKPDSEGMNELYEYANRFGMTLEQLKAASDSDNLPSQNDIDHINTLFSKLDEPNQDSLDELNQYANKLGLTLDELRNLAKDGGPTESRQSILSQKIDADQKSLDQAEQSLDYYKKSYEEYVSKVPDYRDKIENGGTDIESFTGDQKTQIENAMKAYDSMLDAQEKVKEFQKKIRDEKGTYYDTIVDKATKENEKLATANDLIQKQIDLLNTQGSIVSADMYEEMISNTGDQIDTYQQILQARQDELADSMERGLKPGTEEWYSLTAAVMEAKGNIKDLEKAQAEYEKQLRELPVTNLEKIGNIYQSILDTIQNWGAEMEASGKTLNADYYQKLINNANTSISNYKEEIEAIQDVMEDYTPGTDNWNEMNDKLQQCNSSISSLVQNMHKWNEELLNLPIQKISDASDSLSKIVDGLNDVKSEHETVISAVTGAISDEIDRLNDEKEAYEDTINDQKEALQDRMDLLDKQNEKLKLQAQYEQALYDLENATTQKTEKVIRNGEMTYESNADNLRNAQESVQDALAALKKQELQAQMDALDDALDDYNDKLQDTLDSLQKISDKWSEIASKKEQADNEKTATDILGKNWKDKVLSGNDADIFQMFSKLYTDNVDQINKYQEQIDSTEHISSLIQEYIDSYKAGTLTYKEAQAGIHDLVSQMNQKMSAMDNLQNIYNYMGKVYDTAANGDAVFGGIQKAFKESGDQLISSLQQYQANAGLISESMSSWQQLTNNVESIKDILEDVKDNLKDTERDRDDDDDDRGSGKSHVTGKHSSKSVYGSSGFSAEKHHSGVFSGIVGSSSADKTNKIKVLEAEKLEPNEVPAILEHGEMVFTPEQVQKFAECLGTTTYVPDRSWMKNMYIKPNINEKPNTVNISMGDVKLTDVRDVDGFAKAMKRDFAPLARQAMARF